MHWMMSTATQEIAATAARMVVEEGLEYGPAKRRAVKQLGLPQRTAFQNRFHQGKFGAAFGQACA